MNNPNTSYEYMLVIFKGYFREIRCLAMQVIYPSKPLSDYSSQQLAEFWQNFGKICMHHSRYRCAHKLLATFLFMKILPEQDTRMSGEL